jgi:hypothetical protein
MAATTSKPSKRDPRFYGTVCQRHPEKDGERYSGNNCCVECRREAHQRRRQLVKDNQLFWGFDNHIGQDGWPTDARHPANKPVKTIEGWVVPPLPTRR